MTIASTPPGENLERSIGHRAAAGRGTSHGFDMTTEITPLSELLSDLWAARDLIGMLARKDFLVRYRRASFGLLWAVGLPLFQASVMALVFSKVVRIHTSAPYPVFVFAGFVPWSYFSGTISAAATAIVDSAGLASKIYFPRAVLPLNTIFSNLYGFAVTVVALYLMAGVFGIVPGLRILLVIPAVISLVALTASLSLLFSAAHVYFRDMRYLVQAALTVWLYVTPVFYPLQLAPHRIRMFLSLNPMTGVVELFRASVVGADPGWTSSLYALVVWIVAATVGALVLHRRFNRVFSDLM
jgi:ABC-type polysaccharide/polyol phosphate export permease